MPAYFFCKTGEFAGSSFEIASEAVIGRGEEAIRLPAEVVSGRHARIYFDAERKGYFLEDLQSRNGTKLDGMAVTEPVKLGRLHVVTFADRIDFIYHEGPAASAPKPATPPEAEQTRPGGFVPPLAPPTPQPAAEDKGSQTQLAPAFTAGSAPPVPPPAQSAAEDTGNRTQFAPAFTPTPPPSEEKTADNQTIRTQAFNPAPLPSAPEQDVQHTHFGPAFVPTPNLPGSGGTPHERPAAPARARFSLHVMKGGRDVTHPLTEGENVVGRAANCSVVLDSNSVSRQHAAVTVRDGRATIKDLGSRNRTFLDGSQVDSEVEVPVGAVIRFGLEVEATLKRG